MTTSFNPVEIRNSSYHYVAVLELPDGSRYHLEAHLELDTHPINKYPQIVFNLFDSMHQKNKNKKNTVSVTEKERVFQALMERLDELGVVIVITKGNKWFELSKAIKLYYLKPYKPCPKRDSQMNLLDLV